MVSVVGEGVKGGESDDVALVFNSDSYFMTRSDSAILSSCSA